MNISFHSFDVPAPPGVSDEQARSAALWLAENAKDAADRRDLLEACGLVPYDGKPVKSRGGHSPVILYPVPGQ